MRVRLPLVLVLAVAFALLAARPASAQKAVFPDRVYGEGGSREIETKTYPDGSKTTTITVRDKNGTIREVHKTTEDRNLPTTPVTESHEFWDAKGNRAGGGYVMYDHNGDLNWWQEEHYGADEKRDSGELYQRDNDGNWTHSRWDKKLEKWVPIKPKEGETPGPPQRPPARPRDIEISSGAYFGLALLLEDGGNRFTTLGFDASYTHALSTRLGVIADVQWTRGTNEGVTYTKVQALGGIAFRPYVRGDFYLVPHALAGIASVSSDYGSEMSAANMTTSAFALAVGVDTGLRISNTIDVQGRVDYNPTIQSGDVRHNIRLSAGLRFRF